MILPRWRYCIAKEDGRTGRVTNGVVTFDGSKSKIPSPDGWQGLQIMIERPTDKHGLTQMQTLPNGLVLQAAHIVRDALYKQSIEEKLFLLIQRLKLDLTPTKFKWVYRYFFKGELDLSQTDDGQDVLSVPIMEGGLAKLVKANWATNYEFPMNDQLCVNLLMDGILLDKKGNFAIVDGFEIENEFYAGSFFIPLSLLNQEGSAAGIAFFSQELESTETATLAERAQSTNLFASAGLANSGDIELHITGKIVYHCTYKDDGFGFGINLLKSDESEVGLFNDAIIEAGQTYSHDIDTTITLSPGQFLHMEGIYSVTGALKIQFDATSKLSVEYSYRSPATYVKAYKRFDLFKKIVKAITGSEDFAVSDLCTEFNDLLITCGDAIRGIEGATLKTSLADFYQDTDATLMAGIYIQPNGPDAKIEIEDRLKYYTEQADVDAINLGEVLDLHTQPAIDLICNTYKFGHQKQNIDDVNGKYDPNGNNQFTGPITKVIKEYNGVSPYKAGPYEIEILRINLEGKTSTDDNRDNDVYVIAALPNENLEAEVSFINALNGMVISDPSRFAAGQKIRITGSASNDGVYDILSVNFLLAFSVIVFAQPVVDEATVPVTIEWLTGNVYSLNRPAYDTLEGVPTDTIFNLPYLTPKAMMMRHFRWIAGINYGLASKKIVFTSGKDNKNTELKTVLAGVTIDEDKDEAISPMGEPMFLPFYHIAKFNPLTMQPEDLEDNSNRSFIFSDIYGNEWRDFLRIAGIAPNDFSQQEFKLLLSPSNDPKLLIH